MEGVRKFAWPCCSQALIGWVLVLGAFLWALFSRRDNVQYFDQCPTCHGTRFADYAAVPCGTCGGSGVVRARRGCRLF